VYPEAVFTKLGPDRNKGKQMEQKYEDFYKDLRRKVQSYLDRYDTRYADILLLAPDLFHLLVRLSLDERVPTGKKTKFVAAIVYFISPLDFLPEMFLGPLGYLDDIALAAYVLNDFLNDNDPAIVRELWAGDQDILSSVKNILAMADHMIGSGLWEKVKSKVN
jgi:uncharacterized membrane protein YkvA (DUF1232 family)